MKEEWLIAQRLYYTQAKSQRKSRPAVRVALAGIIIGVLVMLLSVCVVVGFKQEVSRKVAGFGSHIRVVNFDSNSTFELAPIRINDSLLTTLSLLPYVKHVSLFATKPGILKTDSTFMGVVFKGTDYWDYFADNLLCGTLPEQDDQVLISQTTADAMQLSLDDQVLCYFVEDQLRVRRLQVSGIYHTCMNEMDRMFILGHINLIRNLNHWQDNQASGIEILVDDLRHLDIASDAVFYATANRLDEDGSGLYSQTLKQLNPQIFGWLDLLDMNVLIILLLMLAVSSFSIITGLIILIMDSVTLIGTLKALGANNRFVRKIFIFESTMLVLKGVILGNIFGLSLAAIQYFTHLIPLSAASYYVSFVPIAFPWLWIILLNIAFLLIGFLIMLAPSIIAARISPTQVMQFD